MSPLIDKDADGRITSEEYEVFQQYKVKNPGWQNNRIIPHLTSASSVEQATILAPQLQEVVISTFGLFGLPSRTANVGLLL